MFTRADVISDYELMTRRAAAVKLVADETLLAYASRLHYLYQSRLKDRESFLQKLETGRVTATHMSDILACSLIVPTLDQVRPCIDGIPSAIRILREVGPKDRAREPDVFSYDEWQLACVLNTARLVDGMAFEVQVKTVTQYAWGEATHDLVYKGDKVDWRRVRLSAQLRAHAEQADMLYSEFLVVSQRLTRGRSKKWDALDYVARRLNKWLSSGLVPTVRKPSSPVRFAECIVAFCDEVDIRPRALCDAVGTWLRSNAYPVSLTLYQTVVGVAISELGVDLSRARADFRYFLTAEVEDAFPAVRSAPLDRAVSLGDP